MITASSGIDKCCVPRVGQADLRPLPFGGRSLHHVERDRHAEVQYKSPTLIVSRGQLVRLDQDLPRLSGSGASHPQIAALREVVARAVTDGCALTVSGDMYPELWRQEAEPSAAADGQ